MGNFQKKFAVILILFLAFSAKSQEFGSYFIQQFTTQDYKGDAQNWVIDQDKRGIIYVGNTSMLLEFDGKYWNHYYNNKKFIIRSIDISENGIIYTGSTSEFGFFKANKQGKLDYFSLSDSISDKTINFQDIWKTVYTNDAVYFFSDNYIFLWSENKIKVIVQKTFPFYGNYINGKLYIVDALRGLYILEDTTKTLLENTLVFVKKSGFIHILENDDQNKLFIVTSRNGLYEYNLITKESTKISSEIDDFLSENLSYSAIKVDTNLYAIGTSKAGIIIIDGKGNLKNIINKNNGLLSESVYYLFADKDKNLWAGLQNGICRIDLSYPIIKFSDNHNLNDYIIDAEYFDNKIYLASLSASYVLAEKNFTSLGGTQSFKKFETDGIWDLFVYDNNLFGVGYQGIFQYKDTTVENIFYKGDIIFCTAKTSKVPDHLFLGTKSGLSYITFKNLGGNNFYADSLIKFGNTTEEIRYLTTDNQNNIWISTKNDGIFLLRFYSNNINDYQLTKFDEKNGLNNSKSCKAELINGEIKIMTAKGILKPVFPENENSPDSLITFVSDDFLGSTFTSDSIGVTELIKISNSKFLFTNDQNMNGIVEINDDSIIFDTTFLKRIPYIAKLRYSEPSKLYICSNDAFYIYDLGIKKSYKTDYKTLIREVTIGEDSLIFFGTFFNDKDTIYSISISQTDNFIPKIKYNLNSITIKFSSNFLEDADNNTYSFYFEGYSEKWSEWSDESKAVLTNIHEGKYIFKVKTKNIYSIESEITEYTFIILPPWYRTWWAYIIWITLILITLVLLIKVNTIRLERKNRKLEKIVEERTAELVTVNNEVKKQNSELYQQNEEIQAQAEELHSQTEELQVINNELEKLSIVARETDNAIMIFNYFLELEWVNNAFNKLYGYALEEVIKKHIRELSSKEEILDIIDECIKTKESISYDALILTKDRRNIWIQTTITPIFDYDGKLNKLIAVESNINDLKLAQKEISNQNKLITSSINYAVTIQNSILPLISDIQKDFDFFVIFRPKDIVSGDFYWYAKTENYYFIAVVDCTGHGVPGAFMSLISNRLINEIVLVQKFYDTSEILDKLDSGIKKALHQETTENTDGMDVSLVRIEKYFSVSEEKFNICFTGARQSLLYFSDKTKIQTKIKGDIRRIGGYSSKLETIKFTNFEIPLDKNDVIYLKSDGFEDQCNSSRKKFGKGKLKRLISEIASEPFENQKDLFEKELDAWQLEIAQRDDITLLGLKL